MIKKYLWLIVSLLFAGVAWAAESGNTISTASIDSTAVSEHTDISIAYLAQVFGSVGNVLQGTSGQMLGQLMYRFNQGVLVVAGLWLIYTIFTMVMRSAMEGSFSGPNKNTALVFLRVALGVSFLVPSTSTGYSLLQGMTLKVTVEGVKLADSMWSYALDYLQQGGVVWHRPIELDSSSGVSGEVIESILKNSLSPVFRAEVCMALNEFARQASNNTAPPATLEKHAAVAPSTASSVVTSDYFGPQLYPQALPDANGYTFPAGPGKNNMGCGKISWHASPEGERNFAGEALNSAVDALVPAAHEYACYLVHSNNNFKEAVGGKTPGSCPASLTAEEANDHAAEALFSALANYANIAQPAAGSHSDRGARDFIDGAKKEGWISAGRYYWDMSKLSRGSSGSIQSMPVGMSTQQIKPYSRNGSDDYLAVFTDDVPISSGAIHARIFKDIRNYNGASDAGDTGGFGKPGEQAVQGLGGAGALMFPVIGQIIQNVVRLIMLFSNAPEYSGGMGPDPVLFLHHVGMVCINLASDIFFTIALLVFGVGLVTMICQAELNLNTPVNMIVSWIQPPLMIIAIAALVSGVTNGFYVPLYPYMLYTFGVVSWFISVIEAVVAAPLIAFGLTHPEGHDFMGESKQGLMLLLGVFLRPALTVVGLIAGMILSYVTLRFLVFSYGGLTSDLFSRVVTTSGGGGSVEAGVGRLMGNLMVNNVIGGFDPFGLIVNAIMTVPLFLMIFSLLVFTVVEKCYSLIYVLPDYILKWIGGPQSTSSINAGQMASEISGKISQGVKTSGQAVSSGLEAVQKSNENQSSGEMQGKVGGAEAPDAGGGADLGGTSGGGSPEDESEA